MGQLHLVKNVKKSGLARIQPRKAVLLFASRISMVKRSAVLARYCIPCSSGTVETAESNSPRAGNLTLHTCLNETAARSRARGGPRGHANGD